MTEQGDIVDRMRAFCALPDAALIPHPSADLPARDPFLGSAGSFANYEIL